MRGHLLLGLLLSALVTHIPLHAQDASIESRLERMGVRPAAAREFFGTLRRGLGTGSRREVCALVGYPLRQPAGGIASPQECEARYDEIFTIAVRRAVGRSQFEDLFVAPAGIVVGFGELWFARCQDAGCPEGSLRITEVNGAADRALQPPRGKVLLACATSEQRVQVIADGQGGAELRLWPGNAATGSPSASLKSLPGEPPRSPECAFRSWSFGDASDSYAISEVACAGLAGGVPPMGSVGQVLRVTAPGRTETLWCVE